MGLILWLPLDENSERSYSLSGTYSVIEGPTGPVEIPGGASGKEPACQVHETYETHVQPLGQKDPSEEDMITHSSILAWRIPWLEEPGRLQFMGSKRVRHD